MSDRRVVARGVPAVWGCAFTSALALAMMATACGDNARGTSQVDAGAPMVDGMPPVDALDGDAVDAGIDAPDGGIDAASDAAIDAGVDAAPDAGIDAAPDATIDAGIDAAPDAGVDAAVDAGIDAVPDAGIDAAPDAPVDAAPDAPAQPPVPVVNVRIADTVVAAPGATGTGFGDPTRAINGVRGAGLRSGSLDVFSRGYTPNQNDHITLAWSRGRLQNGPGADLVVFENPFLVGASGAFMDLVIVEVSLDGVEYRELAHDYLAENPAVYRNDPALWQGFAGRTPVLLNVDNHVVDPFDTSAAGGDAFDLDTVVGDDPVARAIRAEGARFVRLVCAPARINPRTGAAYVRDAQSNGADIDGMYGRYMIAE